MSACRSRPDQEACVDDHRPDPGRDAEGDAVDAIGGETQVVASRGAVDRGGVPLVHAVLVPLGAVLSRTPRLRGAGSRG